MNETDHRKILAAQDLLAGSGLIHEIDIPPELLRAGASGTVRLRPLSIATLTLISRAAREDAGLIPLLMIKEALVEPVLTLDQIRQLQVGLVCFLVSRVNQISGLTADGETLSETANLPLSQTHVLLAKHFGWTPEQVSQLTPGQVAVYLAGIEKLLQLEGQP
jgi:hypothetical protein